MSLQTARSSFLLCTSLKGLLIPLPKCEPGDFGGEWQSRWWDEDKEGEWDQENEPVGDAKNWLLGGFLQLTLITSLKRLFDHLLNLWSYL